MTYKLPLIAAFAATLASPALAQGINDMLNPQAMIAEMGLGQIMHGSAGNRIAGAPRVIDVAPAEIAALSLDTTVLSSPRPVLRPSTLSAAEIVRVPSAAAAIAGAPEAGELRDMIGAMDIAAANAPAGANTLVVSGADTVAVSGTNTAVIQSGPAPRLSLWQRIFGE